MQVTWLHVSDFHIRGGDSYDRDVVLRALVKSVQDFRERGRTPDLVFATGDIAHAGKVHEYDLATQFFDALIEAAGVDRRHLFVIPETMTSIGIWGSDSQGRLNRASKRTRTSTQPSRNPT